MGGSRPHSPDFLRKFQVHRSMRQSREELDNGVFQGNIIYGDGTQLLRDDSKKRQMHCPGSGIGLHLQTLQHAGPRGSTLPTSISLRHATSP